ncbi:two-component system, sporulation sensor kinase B [Shouchella rhizosphaerae]|nr:two-component system, sporulation sensor kinase B [Shouchella rhizosphaerae]
MGCMVIEKLLINVFVIMVPLIIYSLKAEGGWKIQRSLTMFHFMSGAVILCMSFSIRQGDVFWDLRYIPILLAFLYGGKRAGWGVTAVSAVFRLIVGGDLTCFALVHFLLSALLFSIFTNRFYQLPSKWPRLKFVSLVSLWPVLIQVTLSLIIMQWLFRDSYLPAMWGVAVYYAIFGVGAMFLITYLYETLLERDRVIAESLRAEKYNSLNELAATIAHEVRNPLTVVKGFVQLMAEGEKKNQYHALIVGELNRAEAIINEYLSAAKPKMDQQRVFSVGETVHSVVSLLRPYAAKGHVQLSVESSEETLWVWADQNKLKQALLNFIKNGIEATPPNGAVLIKLDKTAKKKLLLTIEDTGVGMTKEQLKQIGTAYFTTKDSGTGIGTMVSIRMIEMMGGHVSYASKPKKGTCVHIMLPLYDKAL